MFMVLLSRPILTGAAGERQLCARLWCADAEEVAVNSMLHEPPLPSRCAHRDFREIARALALGASCLTCACASRAKRELYETLSPAADVSV
jgi:hypothetical protein